MGFRRSVVSMGVSPSILSTSFLSVRGSVRVLRGTGYSVLRLSIVSNVFMPGVSFNMPLVGSVGTRAGVPLSIRLVVSHPRHCVGSFTTISS